MKATFHGLATTGLALTLAVVPTYAQMYRTHAPGALPGVVFAATTDQDRERGLDGFHLDYMYTLVREQLDPIVSPNEQSAHMHRVFGGSNFGAAYNRAELYDSDCTSAGISVDKSNYWEPQLYWIETNGQFTPIDTISRFYYFLGRVDASIPVKPFPKGLRMLAGSPYNKAPIANNAAEFICQIKPDFSGSLGLDNFNFLRDCPYGMKTAMHFPSCWDGVNLYKTDNSHMAYPVVNPPRDGGCPYTHPHKLPTIFLESTWHMSQLPQAAKKPLKGRLAWANGDTTGYGFHADFTDGAAQNCPVLGRYMTTQDIDNAQACQPARGVLLESYGNNDTVTIPTLPGGAKGDKPTCDPAVPVKDVSNFKVEDGDYVLAAKDQMPFKLDNSSGWHETGCFGTAVNVGVFDGNITYTDTGLNPGRCQESCSKNGMPFAGLENIGPNYLCICGKALLPQAFNVYSGCDKKCPGDASETCGGQYKIQAYYQNPQYIGIDKSAVYMGCLGHTTLTLQPTLMAKASLNVSRSDMTREKCLKTCKDNGETSWAAVQGKQ
ncbi:hypothetical protein QFC21_002562 [Naganishia friedmannii]|uniref:Uncharacterized protein n=1 Tax=Naganishia friedmannii TaxID=89922 RepID=A0ACC2VWA3_9TREE|nr:hypothetical protein QFC21_002562 [Naganishia friedmannii]